MVFCENDGVEDLKNCIENYQTGQEYSFFCCGSFPGLDDILKANTRFHKLDHLFACSHYHAGWKTRNYWGRQAGARCSSFALFSGK